MHPAYTHTHMLNNENIAQGSFNGVIEFLLAVIASNLAHLQKG